MRKINHFLVVTNKEVADEFYRNNNVLSRDGNGVLLETSEQYLDEYLYDKQKKQDGKRKSNLILDFQYSEDRNPQNLTGYHKKVYKSLNIPPFQEIVKRKQKKNLMQRIRNKIVFGNQKTLLKRVALVTGDRPKTTLAQSRNKPGLRVSFMFNPANKKPQNTQSTRHQSVMHKRPAILGAHEFSPVAASRRATTPHADFLSMVRPSTADDGLMRSIGDSKIDKITGKKKYELTHRSMKKEREFLKQRISKSERKRQVSKLGEYVSSVDHTDLIISSQLFGVGKQFLELMGKDPEKLKEEALAENVQANDPDTDKQNLDTNHTQWIRKDFFRNIMKGNRKENEKMVREFFLDFQCLRKRQYLKLPSFDEKLAEIIKKTRKENIGSFNEARRIEVLKGLKSHLKKAAETLQDFIDSLFLNPNSQKKMKNNPRYPISALSRIARRPELMINPSSTPTAEMREMNLTKIKTRVSETITSNLEYYKMKDRLHKSLLSSLSVHSQDLAYKRSMLSKSFVASLVRGKKGEIQKVRKDSEINRRKYYKKKLLKEAVKIYLWAFQEIAEFAEIMDKGITPIKDLLCFFKILIEEGSIPHSGDALMMKNFLDRCVPEKDMSGAERKIVATFLEFASKNKFIR